MSVTATRSAAVATSMTAMAAVTGSINRMDSIMDMQAVMMMDPQGVMYMQGIMMMVERVANMQTVMNMERIKSVMMMAASALRRNQIRAVVAQRERVLLAGEKDDKDPCCEGQKQILHVKTDLNIWTKALLPYSPTTRSR